MVLNGNENRYKGFRSKDNGTWDLRFREEYTEFYNEDIVKVYDNADLAIGRELTIATGGEIEELVEKAEGEAMATGTYGVTAISVRPTVKARKVPISAEAAGAFNTDLLKDVENGLVQAYRKTMNTNVFNRIKSTATVAIDKSTVEISLEEIVNAMALMEISDGSELVLYVSHKQVAQLRNLKDVNGNSVWAPELLAEQQKTGVIGSIYGVKVRVSKLIVPSSGVVTNYLVEKQVVGMVFAGKNTVNVSGKFNEDNLEYTIYTHIVCESYLPSNKKIQPIKFKA